MISYIVLILLFCLIIYLFLKLNNRWYSRNNVYIAIDFNFVFYTFTVSFLLCLYFNLFFAYSLLIFFCIYPLCFVFSYFRRKLLYSKIIQLVKKDDYNPIMIDTIIFDHDQIIIHFLLKSKNEYFKYSFDSKKYKNYYPNKASYFSILKSIKMNLDDANLILNQINDL